MASLEEKLALSRKMTNIEKTIPKQNLGETQSYVFNKPGDEPKPYNAKEDLKRLQGGLPQDLSHCKLPQSIIESIIKNPLTDISINTEMDSFTESLGESLGLKQSVDIIDKLNKREEKITENKTINVDYEMIKMIVENVIDKKLDSFKQTLNILNENKTQPVSSNLKTMHFGDKFLFLDSDDNVYECVMQYKGKRKKR